MNGALLLVASCLLLGVSKGEFLVPGLSRECYTKPGDLLFGVVWHLTQSENDDMCVGTTPNRIFLDKLETLNFAIGEINADPTVLPNITIGFVFLDSCFIQRLLLAQAMYMVPSDGMVTPNDVTACHADDAKLSYDVKLLIGSGVSTYTLPVALAMTMAQIPLLGTTETSDELSDETRFEYFIPFSLADSYQTKAILELLSHYNWTYFSLVYSAEAYGENAAREIQNNVQSYGLCIEHVFAVPSNGYDMMNYLTETVYPKLSDSTVSTVIVSFLGYPPLFFATLPVHLYGRFIFVASDAASYHSYGDSADGMFMVTPKYAPTVDFQSYYESLTALNNAANPWWKYLWQQEFSCTWNSTSGDDCTQYENMTLQMTGLTSTWASTNIDAVYTAAHGLHLLINKSCPDAFSDQSLLDECITGPEYLAAIYNVSFEGLGGRVEFNEEGKISSSYHLAQYSSETRQKTVIGSWHNVKGLLIKPELIDWQPINGGNPGEIPESVCSRPCEIKQYIIQKEVECCWECLYCRDNEIIIDGGTGCDVCSENSWPDDETAAVCEDIPPTYVHWTDRVAIILTLLAIIGILCDILCACALVIHRKKKLIKASGRELMVIILLGTFLAFSCSLTILARPTPITCFFGTSGFSFVLTVIYAPLLTKTVRVYRIFRAGEQGVQFINLISVRSQLVVSSLLLSIQVIVVVIVGILAPSDVLSRMPILNERYSELVCTMPPEVLVALLAYNLVLLVPCSVFGFLTHKLPENFNEAGFILGAIVATLFTWVVFLPTYFTTFYAYDKTVILSTCLLLNGYIPLFCLFFPKMYAAWFVEEARLKFITTTVSVAAAQTVSTYHH